MGNGSMQIGPKTNKTYELYYLPLKVGRAKGTLSFVNEQLGEIWYNLNLICEDSTAIRLPLLKCELGKVETQELRLENPSDFEVPVKYQLSNQLNFEITPESIVIPPKDSLSVYLKFVPS
jgi:hypothetical protein